MRKIKKINHRSKFRSKIDILFISKTVKNSNLKGKYPKGGKRKKYKNQFWNFEQVKMRQIDCLIFVNC